MRAVSKLADGARGRLRERSARWIGGVCLAAGVIVLASCGGGSSDPCGIDPSCVASSGGGSSGSSSGSPAVPVAADISLTLASPTVLNGGADTVEARVTAVDANRNLLRGVPVTFSVDSNATALVSSQVTDASGVITARVGIGADRANRVVTVTATSGSLTRSVALQVTGTRVTATALPSALNPGATGTVRFKVIDINSSPLRSQAITVTGVSGVDVAGTTDTNGEFVYSYTAPSTAGSVNVSAMSAGAKVGPVTILVQPPATVPAAARTPAVTSASVSLSSGVVPVNSANTSNLIEVRALILREGNLPAERIRVRFDLDGNLNSIPGTLSTGDSLIYTDASGIATTSYAPGSRASPLEGVTIRACWDYADFAAGTCPNATRSTLTVIAEPLSVSVGTDNKITFGPTSIDYQKSYLVQVNDAAGAPKGEVQLTATVDLLGYYMGFWELVGVDWKQRVTAGLCDNEDLNRNAAADVYPNGVVEDANRNGQLDPRKADVVVSVVGNGRTNALGQAVLNLNYLQNAASWVMFRVTVTAGGTGGSEGRASFTAILPVLDEHVTSQDRIRPPPPPAFVQSPYNVAGTVPTAVPTPSGGTAILCRRP
jgi:Bacterial Ig-like domain (group 1)